VTPRELYELADRLGHHRQAIVEGTVDMAELRADLARASRCVRDLNSVLRLVGNIAVVPFASPAIVEHREAS
jgi:hypothetical protein